MFLDARELGYILDGEREYIARLKRKVEEAGLAPITPEAEHDIRLGYRTTALVELGVKRALRAEIQETMKETRERCRVCDTDSCGTMYCKTCYDEVMAERDRLQEIVNQCQPSE